VRPPGWGSAQSPTGTEDCTRHTMSAAQEAEAQKNETECVPQVHTGRLIHALSTPWNKS